MKLGHRIRRWRDVGRPVLVSLLIVAMAGGAVWLSTKPQLVSDWSVVGRGGLSEATMGVLRTLSEPVHLTAFIRDEPVARRMISQWVERYRLVYAPISLMFVDPVAAPQQLAAVPGASEGMILLVYGTRRLLLNGFSEQRLTSGLLKVQRAEHRFLLFVTGHGERDPGGSRDRDISALAQRLRLQGVQIQTLNLAQLGVIPDNTAALVIASPRVSWLAQEVELVRRYVDRGGNLLWLVEPGEHAGLEALARDLGVSFGNEPLVDSRAREGPGGNDSTVLGFRYGHSGITQNFDMVTAFTEVTRITVNAPGYRLTPLVEFNERAGTADSLPASSMLGVTLERDVPLSGVVHEQRVVVIGDGDFLSDAYLATAGNLEFALRVTNWVQQDDVAVSIPAVLARDARLQLSTTLLMVLGVGFLLVLPAGFGLLGIYIWWRRQRLA